MDTDKIILIFTNILVSIIVALIGLLATRKYKKDIELLKLTHINELEKIELQYKHQIELLQQQAGMNIAEGFTNKLLDEALKNEDVQRKLHQGISSGMQKKKR